MQPTTKTRLVRIVVGLVSGSAINALLTAVLFFTAFYTATHESFTSVILGWAFMAGLSGGAFGYLVGLVLGLFLGLTRRGPIFGALSGGVLGVALITVSVIFDRNTDWELHVSVIAAGIILVTVLSGFFISLVLSAITSLTKRTNDGGASVPCSVA